MSAPLVIALDMDSTILDNEPVWENIYRRNSQSHMHGNPTIPIPDWDHLAGICPDCWKECLSFKTARDIPFHRDAEDSIAMLSEFADIYVISHRPPDFATTGLDIFRRSGLSKYITGYEWSWRRKSESCADIGASILLDDSPRVFEDLASVQLNGLVGVCFAQGYNKHVHAPRVESWPDFLDYVFSYLPHLLPEYAVKLREVADDLLIA